MYLVVDLSSRSPPYSLLAAVGAIISNVVSEISRNEISRNVSRNFYFAFREIFELLSRNFAKRNSRNFAKFRGSDLTKLYRNLACLLFKAYFFFKSEFQFNI
jgi:hypothetical protein